jgi:glutamine phosphoribosylpyrophosphate amidotransferase
MTTVGEERGNYCAACFTGDYPITVPEDERDQLKLFAKSRD